MDSVTQFALGAVVGTALLGKRIGPRKAALIGGLMGMVPDLDTFLPADDPVQSFTSHRGFSHSLIVQAVVTPLFAEPLVRLMDGLRDARIRTYAAVYLIFATHALIDAMTVYGTRLFWPLFPDPVGVGSIFIIDPLYTLPLLAMTLFAFFQGQWRPSSQRWSHIALAVSTAYMLLTMPLQAIIERRAAAMLDGVPYRHLIAIPTPMNVLYWQTIAVTDDSHVSLYMPLFGNADNVTTYAYPRYLDLAGCLAGTPAFESLKAFTKGFYRMEQDSGAVVFNDLRMGLAPNYVFRFALADMVSGEISPRDVPARKEVIREVEGDIDWLLAGISGKQKVRLAEQEAYIGFDALAGLATVRAQGLC